MKCYFFVVIFVFSVALFFYCRHLPFDPLLERSEKHPSKSFDPVARSQTRCDHTCKEEKRV